MAADLTHRRLSQTLAALADVQLELDGERLRRARADALLDRVLGSMSDGVLIVDPHGRVTRSNRAATRLFGRTAAELEASSVASLYGDEVPGSPWALLEAAPHGQLSVETTAVGRDGGRRPVTLSCAVMRDADGKVEGVVHAARDVSEVHRLLREVEAAEARWRLLADVSDLLATGLDPEEALVDVVGRLEAATGCGAAVVRCRDGVATRVVASPATPARAAVTSLEGSALPTGSALATSISDGRTVHAAVMATGFPLLGPGELPLRSAATMPLSSVPPVTGALMVVAEAPGRVDEPTVTLMEEVATRIGLALANADLRDTLVAHLASTEATQYRDDILAAVSHDMKTPLTVLLGLVGLLDKPEAADSRAEIHHGITRQAHRLRRLVVQFLDYVRLEAGVDLAVTPEPVDLAAVIAAGRDVAGGSRVRVTTPGTLPRVRADESRLELALANLVSNAVKYAPAHTPVTIDVRTVGRHVEISVIDEGPGIPPAAQRTLFDKFEHGHRPTGVEGTGLGLYMTRQLMRSQGGEVRVASRAGHGSRFTLVLPRAGEGEPE